MPHSGVQLLLDRSGQVTVYCGATEIGQGSDDVLAAIVAEALGVDTGDVRCVTGDTGITPIDLGSYSSRVTIMMGNAALQAAARVREQLAAAVAEQLDTLPERVVFSQGAVFAAENPGNAHELRRGGGAGGSEVRHAGRGRLLLAAQGRRASTRARASARRPPTASRPAWSRRRSIEHTGWITCRRSGSRTTSAARSIPCSRAAR